MCACLHFSNPRLQGQNTFGLMHLNPDFSEWNFISHCWMPKKPDFCVCVCVSLRDSELKVCLPVMCVYICECVREHLMC